MSYYDFTLKLIAEAAQVLMDKYASDFDISTKGGDPRNFVTSIDMEVNDFLIGKIQETYPNHAIYSEEGGGQSGSTYLWALDPIDGTSNFLRRIPHFALSVTLLEDGIPIVGAVLNPITQELYSFERGNGAYLNGKRVSVSERQNLSECWVPYRAGGNPLFWDWGSHLYRALIEHANKTGSFGSLALDVCFVGAGKVDALVYGRASLLDNAGSVGFLKEAGGVLANFDGAIPELVKTPTPIIFANSISVLDALLEVLPKPKDYGIDF